MQENRKSNLFVRIAPFVLAPLLFGISALLLSLGDYMGPWYYILYFLSHFLSVGAVFLALHLVFKASAERKMPKALTAAIPLLTSLSVFHVAISIYEAYFLHYEEASTTAIYALLSLFTDSLLSEWLLTLLTAVLAYLFFLRGEPTKASRRSAWIFSALIYFVYLAAGRVFEFLSILSAHFGFVDEKTTVSVLVFFGSDLLLAAFGYLVLFLSDKLSLKKVEAK